MPDDSKKPVLIIGGGGHATVVLDALRASGQTIAGICDQDPAQAQARFPEETIIDGDDAALALPPDEISIAIGGGSTRSPAARAALFARYHKAGFGFATVIHPSAIVAPNAEIGAGAQLMAGCVLQPNVTIGVNAVVNTGAIIDHDSRIGDHAFISPGVTLSGGVEIGQGCHIGAGATIIEYRRVGETATVGAGAVVIHDVAIGATVTGVPAIDREFKTMTEDYE